VFPLRGSVRWLLVASVAAMLVLVTGIGPLFQVSRAQSTTLTFLGPKFDEWDAFVKVANQLGKDMGIQVKAEFLPWEDVFKKALIDFKSGVRTWDLVYAYNTWVPGIAASKVFTPISDFYTNAEYKKMINPDDFIKETTAGLEFEGKLWAFPTLAAPYVLAYRTDLLANADEKAAFRSRYKYDLAVPKTYKQLLDTAQFFTRKKGAKVAGRAVAEDFYGICLAGKPGGFLFHRYEMVLVAFGADLIYNLKTMQPTVNSRESIAAAKYYVELHKYQQPGSETHSGGGTQRVFAADRCALTMDALDNILSVAEVPKVSKIVGKVGYTVLPTQVPSRPNAHVADANGPGIYALSQHKDQAIKLLARVLSTEGTKELMKEYPALVPMRASVFNDPDVKKTYPKMVEAMNAVIKAKPWTVFVPPLKEWVQAQEIVESALSAALAGQMTPEAAMNQAQGKVVELFKRAGYIK
jgi:multiple sugar transport system substrate-binding protein